jgi:hypothetical protein
MEKYKNYQQITHLPNGVPLLFHRFQHKVLPIVFVKWPMFSVKENPEETFFYYVKDNSRDDLLGLDHIEELEERDPDSVSDEELSLYVLKYAKI